MTNDFDPEFKKHLRRLITERLAQEAVSGGSWKAALEGLKDIFEIDQHELERDIASLIELKSWERKPQPGDEKAPIDLAAQRVQREFEKASKRSKTAKGGSYGSGVRAQVFEVVVRQAMAGAPWRTICDGPMRVNNINPDEVQDEANRRLQTLGRKPLPKADPNNDDDDDDDDEPTQRRGGGGAPVPKNPFPFFGGAGKALGLPGKKRDGEKAASGRDVKSSDSKSHENKTKSRSDRTKEDDDSED